MDAFQEEILQHYHKAAAITTMRTLLSSSLSLTLCDYFPSGLSQLVHHPTWLSRGCNVPCVDKHQYNDWARLRWILSGGPDGDFQEVTCTNPDGSIVNVVVANGSMLRYNFRSNHATMMKHRQLPKAMQWAVNLGASPQEVDIFTNAIQDDQQAWDYVMALMNKAGLLQFQPWIVRDIELFLQLFDLPLQSEYSAIHVHRRDKLEVEAKHHVIEYWRSQGHYDTTTLPTNYIPFVHYLNQWDGLDKCLQNDGRGEVQTLKHNVYVATDDPIVVQQEIVALPNYLNSNTILWNCYELKFFFSPVQNSTAFHLNGHGEDGFHGLVNQEYGQEGGDSCFARYDRNIASIADLMILSKAQTFIGDYNSNWGRLIRTLRVRLNGSDQVLQQEAGDSDKFTVTLDTKIAWGGGTNENHPGF